MRMSAVWEDARSNFWFVPALMGIAAVLLSFATLAVDRSPHLAIVSDLGFVRSGGAEGARELLSTIAGSMITVTSLTFCITIVAFSQASSLYGPRLLNSLMYDTSNQVVLGTFVATFLYSLLILRTVRASGDHVFVPHLSVTVAFIAAVCRVGVLVYFVHHAAVSLQAHHVVAEVAEDLFDSIERVCPHDGDYEDEEARQRALSTQRQARRSVEGASGPLVAVHSHADGYLQGVAVDELVRIASERDLVIRVAHGPGRFAPVDTVLATATPAERVDDDTEQRIRRAFVTGRRRTHAQDVEFGVNQLTEIAVRAMSAGINDPVTAMTCVDWLVSGLSLLAGRTLPSPERYDADGTLWVVMEHPVTFEGLIHSAFGQIRRHAQASLALRLHMLDALGALASRVDEVAYRAALCRKAALIERSAQVELADESDRREVTARLRATFGQACAARHGGRYRE